MPRLTLERCEDRGEISGGDREGVCDEDEDAGACGCCGIAARDICMLGIAAHSGKEVVY